MVQFSGFASLILCIQIRIPPKRWVSPFGHRGIIALLPAPPRFSQAYTSFVAYHRQGIHLMHLFTWLYHFKNLFDFVYLPVDQGSKLEIPTLIKLTALLCLNPAFCVSGLSRYNHHPNTVFVFFSLARDFLSFAKNKKSKQTYCLCLLISAFQFVKDRCVDISLRKSK